MNYLKEQTDGEAMINSIKNEKVVSLDSEGSEADDFSELKKITSLLAKAFNRRKVKCYNCKKEGHFAKDCKKVKVKDYEYYKTKMLLAKKDKDKQVLLAEDQAWMESSSDLDHEINAKWSSWLKFRKFFLIQRLAHRLLMKIFLSENFIENHIDSQKDYDKSDVNHYDSEEKDHLVDKLIQKFNRKIAKCHKRVEKAN
nr:hypothetical protein [Tanacetum cinerariifolium]